jgi:protein O-GlcNAc transferase
VSSGQRKPFQSGSWVSGFFKLFGSKPAATDPALPPTPQVLSPKLDQTRALNEARALSQQGRRGEALAICRQMLAMQPEDIETSLLTAQICADQGDRDQAIALYSKVIELMPEQALAYYKRGNQLKDREQLDAALADYDRAI